MFKSLAASIAMLAMASGCGARQVQVQPIGRAFVQEQLVVRVGSASVGPFIGTLQRSGPLRRVSFNVTEWRGADTGPAPATSSAYTAALDDAARKAQVIAARVRVGLSAIQSVTEFIGATAAQQVTKSLSAESVSRAPRVMVSGDRNVSLAVVYGLSSGGSVAVFGLSDATAHGAAQGVSIYINSSGATADEARDRLSDADAMVRRTARRFGVSPGAISIMSAGFNGD